MPNAFPYEIEVQFTLGSEVHREVVQTWAYNASDALTQAMHLLGGRILDLGGREPKDFRVIRIGPPAEACRSLVGEAERVTATLAAMFRDQPPKGKK